MSILHFSVAAEQILGDFKQELNSLKGRMDKLELSMKSHRHEPSLDAAPSQTIIKLLTEDLNDFKTSLKQNEESFRSEIYKTQVLLNELSKFVNDKLHNSDIKS